MNGSPKKPTFLHRRSSRKSSRYSKSFIRTPRFYLKPTGIFPSFLSFRPLSRNLYKPIMAEKEQLEDDAKEPGGNLLEHPLPWLTLGLLVGMATAVIISKYESILSRDLRLAFFLPIIVYMSDAVGTQTETIYVRHLAKKG